MYGVIRVGRHCTFARRRSPDNAYEYSFFSPILSSQVYLIIFLFLGHNNIPIIFC